MEMRQYEHLIKPLSVGATASTPGSFAIGPGNAAREIRLNGPDHLEKMNLNLSWGIHNTLGDWHAGLDPHVHPYPECLLFVGLDTANINYLGAQIECCLGPEQETYIFDEPTVIVIPAGLPHGPILTKRIYSPKGFGFWAVELNATPEISWLGGAKPTEATGKYEYLVKSLRSGLFVERGKANASRFTPEQLAKMEENSRAGKKAGPGYTDHLIWFTGKELEGLDVNIFWGFSSRPGIWQRGSGAHTHPVDEVLVFMGMDPCDMDYLGAEIEIDIGKEHERHLINEPSAVVCPAGLPHTPQVTRWVDRPFAFFAVSLSGEHKAESFD